MASKPRRNSPQNSPHASRQGLQQPELSAAAFAWFAILLLYLAGLLYVVGSGAAQRILATGELPLVLSGTLALFLVIALQIIVILRGRRFPAGHGFLVFLVPLLFAGIGIEYTPSRGAFGGGEFGGVSEPAPSQGSSVPGSLQAEGGEAQDDRAPSGPAGADRVEDRSPGASAAPSPEQWFGSADAAELPESGAIVIESKNYYDLYNRIYDEMHALEGREVSVEGFVHRESGFSEDEFLIGRMLMWCCSADAALLGFMTRANGQALPEDDAWVTITGTVRPREFVNPHTGEEYEIPYLDLSSIEPGERPQFEYVFPF